MKSKQLRLKQSFHVALGNQRAQAAEMSLAPGKHEGGPDNRHRGSDQWLLVMAGTGTAIVAGKRIRLRPGKLLLIERGEEHEIRNTGHTPLKTANFYVPPAYKPNGDELRRGKS